MLRKFKLTSNYKSIFLAFCFVLLATGLKAQTWEVGGFAGAAGYMGDLNQRSPLKPSGPAAGAFVQRNFNPYLALKLNYTYGKIAGADSKSNTQQFQDRNLSFKTPLNELSLMLEFNLMKYTPGADFNHFSPFLFFGAGVVDYQPRATYQGVEYDLRPLMTEGQSKPYPQQALTFPFGAGIKYNFKGNWNVMASVGYRYVRSDYIDDVSGNYANKALFTDAVALALSDRSGENTGNYIGAAGTQRGDFRGHDTYVFFGFTISYTFVTTNCYY